MAGFYSGAHGTAPPLHWPTIAPEFTLAIIAGRFDLPLLVVTTVGDGDAIAALIEAGAHSVFALGVAQDRLVQSIATACAVHAQIAGHRRVAETAKQDLANRKLVERAKGILMQSRKISEPDAYGQLQKTSMERNLSLPEVARQVIAAKELLG